MELLNDFIAKQNYTATSVFCPSTGILTVIEYGKSTTYNCILDCGTWKVSTPVIPSTVIIEVLPLSTGVELSEQITVDTVVNVSVNCETMKHYITGSQYVNVYSAKSGLLKRIERYNPATNKVKIIMKVR